MSECIAFEKFDKFLISSFDTRSGVQAIYKFKNQYRVSVARRPFYDVAPSKIGLWRVELLGNSKAVNPNKMKKNKDNEWLKKFFSIETDPDSVFFVWYLCESDVETILEEIKRIKVPLKVRLKQMFK